MVTAARRLYTSDEYLALEREADFRSQYYRGEIFAMAGASEPHNNISSNVTISFGVQLRGKPCKSYAADLRIKTSRSGLMTYPDVLVACPPFKYADEKPDTLMNPRVIVEVLLESTESFDRGEKMLAYREIPSLTDYLLISQTHISVEKYSRQADGRWLHEAFTSPEFVIEIPSIECTLNLADIYDKVDFSRAESPSPPVRRV